MDVRTLETVLRVTMTLAFTGWLLLIFEWLAVRRGGSILKNLGARGWLIGFLLVFAADMFSGTIRFAIATSDSFPVDWTLALIGGLIGGGLGVGACYLAWRVLIRGLAPLPGPVPQKS